VRAAPFADKADDSVQWQCSAAWPGGSKLIRVRRSPKAPATFRTLYHESPSKSSFGGQYGLFLIRQSGLWAERWRDLHSGQQPIPPPPPVDLVRETVIVLALGTRPVLGFEVTVEAAQVDPQSFDKMLLNLLIKAAAD
jgi:hypothetical protein